MNYQLHINPTRISILSIPKDVYWMFSSGVLHLLHQESSRHATAAAHSYSESDTSIAEETHYKDSHTAFDSDKDSTGSTSNTTSSGAVKRRSFYENSYSYYEDPTFASSSTAVDGLGIASQKSPVDNSSKAPNTIDLLIETDSEAGSYTTEDEDEDDESCFFFHIAFAPSECTLMCSSDVMHTLFREPLRHSTSAKLVEEEFLTLQLDSDGYDNSSKVLVLTKPLSANNVPLFFLSTHFGDIVLIPESSKEKVISILSQKKFQFSNVSVSVKSSEGQNDSGSNSPNLDIERRAFSLFSEAQVAPVINKSTKLLLTGSRPNQVSETLAKIAKYLASVDITSGAFLGYFAVTRTSLNEVSLLLPQSSKMRAKLGFSSRFITGSTQDAIVPITIDLNSFPLDSTGIVAGLASKLLRGSREKSRFPLEISYLSMTRSGIVMIPQEDVELVSSILEHNDDPPMESLTLE